MSEKMLGVVPLDGSFAESTSRTGMIGASEPLRIGVSSPVRFPISPPSARSATCTRS